MRGRAARDRRALKRERRKFMPGMPFRAYLKAYAKHLEKEAANKKRNAEHASQSRGAARCPG
jgi:hypothetical protein